MIDFFNMGGYGIYIWPSYLIAAIIMIWLLINSISTWREQEKILDNLKIIAKNNQANDKTKQKAI